MFCKNCGAYILTEHEKCSECGAIDGITPIMQIQNALKNNQSVDDILEKPVIDNRPIALKKEPEKSKDKSEVRTESNDLVQPDIKSDGTESPLFDVDDFDDDFDLFEQSELSQSEESVLQPEMQETELSSIDSLFEVAPQETADTLSSLDEEDIVTEVLNSSASHLEESMLTSENVVSTTPTQIKRNNEDISTLTMRNDEAPITSNNLNTDKIQSASTPAQPDINSESEQTQSFSDSADVRSKRKSSSKFIIAILIVLIVILAGCIGVKKSGILDNHTRQKTTGITVNESSLTNEMSTSETEYSVNDSYSYADVIITDENNALLSVQNIVNSYNCGKVLSATITSDFKVEVQTEDYEIIFRLKDPKYKQSDFIDKNITVIGSALYDTISAEKVYVYVSDPEVVSDPTYPEEPITEVPTVIETTTATNSVTVTETTTTKTTPKTTTRRPATSTTAATTQFATVEYITREQANQLMDEWRADGTKLGSNNAYYGRIKDTSVNGDTVTVLTSNYKFVFRVAGSVNTDDWPGQYITVVGKAQSNGAIRASKVYIY